MYVLAGARNVGKTTAALGIAAAAAEAGRRVRVFALAVEVSELTRRMLSTAAGVPIAALNSPRLDLLPRTQQAVSDALNRIGNRVSMIDDHDLVIGKLYAAARYAVRRSSCELILIDHVHAVKADDPRLPDSEHLEPAMAGLAEMGPGSLRCR